MRTTNNYKRKSKSLKYLLLLFLSFMLITVMHNSDSYAQEAIKIMAYNVFEYETSASLIKKAALSYVIDVINPDILIGVEIKDNPATTDHFRTNILSSSYVLGPSPTTTAWGGYSNFVYYKPEKFTFLSSSIVAEFGKWPTLLFHLYNNLTGNKIIIYGVHLSSTGEVDRILEAAEIRVSSANYTNGEYFIAAGDFNLVDSDEETAYGILLDQAPAGYFLDPGDFSQINKTFTSSNITGRYDLILNSQTVMDAGGITYNNNSFMVDGNDGSSSADEIYQFASDHLPVYADFTFAFPSPVNPPYPGSIVFTQVGATDPDVIEFMTLYRMDLTTLKITDNSIDVNGDLSTDEGTFDLINLNGNGDWNDVPAGTFVRLGSTLTNDNDASERILQYKGSTEPITPSLESGGEQLVAYTGTSGSPTYIAGVNWGNTGWSNPTGTTSYPPDTPSDIELGDSDDYSFNSTVNDILYVTRNTLTNYSYWAVPSPLGYQDLTTNIGNSALPVELAFFTGSLNGNNVELRWRTETEVNNYGFDIERTTNSSDWLTIGFAEGHGNSNSPKQYNFSDIDLEQSGTYYYRLKQIDNDGTYEYSDVVSVEVGLPNNFYLSQNYPNPFNPETRIDYTIPEKQLISLRIYNMLGELVGELVNEEKEAGSYSVSFNAANLSSGVYIYRLQTEDFAQNRKMTLLK